jgi:cyclohexanone monooxygenase
VATTDAPQFSPDELKARYDQEMLKRLANGKREYHSLREQNEAFDADPFVEPGFTREAIVEETDCLIVGAGWGGMTTAAYLSKFGVTSYRIVEKAGDFGGTWYWNRYPGCMCDVESYTYLPLLEEVGFMPTLKYSHAEEIFEYAQMLGRHFDMYPHALFQTEVTAMVWNEDTKRWRVTTTRDDVIDARFVVICGGMLHKAHLPDIPGIESYQGVAFHTSRWNYDYTGGGPEAPMDKLADKVVAIVGTGATAIQAVPKLAEACKQLYVFQRTPSSVSPRNQQPTDPEWFAEMSSKPGWHEERMENFIAMTTGGDPEVDLVDDGWTEMFAVDVKKDPADEEEAAALKLLDFQIMEKIRKRIDDTVEDPATAEALKPWYNVSCKRPCFHDDYLPAFNRPNVTLVDTEGRGVERVTEHGLVACGEEYPVDCIVYATGFESPLSFYTHRLGFDPVGEGGMSLSESWEHGVWTLHGAFTHGFPNLAMNSHVQGPQHLNIAYGVTKLGEHTAWVVARSIQEGVTVQPDREAEAAWFDVIMDTVGVYGEYFLTCTPGYLTNEHQMPEERDSRSAAYMHSAVEFRDILVAWREDGSMPGFVKTSFED